MSKIDGIGQKKFSKIITMFSEPRTIRFSRPEIDDKIRADMLNNEVDDTQNATQDVIKVDTEPETETFKSKLAMWETRLGSVEALPIIIKKNNSEKCQSPKSLDIDLVEEPKKTTVKQTKKKVIVKKKQKKRVVKKVIKEPSEDSDDIDPFVIRPVK